jgi:ribA/ribD-fused uncharacterized protein
MDEEEGPIRFYSLRNKWGIFSNYFRGKVQLNGKDWPTTEHYFQAQKFAGTSHEERIRLLKTADEAKKAGNNRSLPLREDWAEVKDALMYEAVYAKFSQRPVLRQRLLETGERELIEHTKNDSYWGDGGDGTGLNMLGKTLMKVRKVLAEEQEGVESIEPKRRKNPKDAQQHENPTERRGRERIFQKPREINLQRNQQRNDRGGINKLLNESFCVIPSKSLVLCTAGICRSQFRKSETRAFRCL